VNLVLPADRSLMLVLYQRLAAVYFEQESDGRDRLAHGTGRPVRRLASIECSSKKIKKSRLMPGFFGQSRCATQMTYRSI
jgi:hypothetical protein